MKYKNPDYMREYYKKNKYKLKEEHKKYYEDNKEELLNKKKIYYQKNINKIKEFLAINRDKLKQKRKEKYYRDKKYRPWILIYASAKQRCENKKSKDYKYYGARGIQFKLTTDDIKQLWFRDKAYLMKKPSIDRIKNDKNYTFSNCRFTEFRNNCKKKNKT